MWTGLQASGENGPCRGAGAPQRLWGGPEGAGLVGVGAEPRGPVGSGGRRRGCAQVLAEHREGRGRPWWPRPPGSPGGLGTRAVAGGDPGAGECLRSRPRVGPCWALSLRGRRTGRLAWGRPPSCTCGARCADTVGLALETPVTTGAAGTEASGRGALRCWEAGLGCGQAPVLGRSWASGLHAARSGEQKVGSGRGAPVLPCRPPRAPRTPSSPALRPCRKGVVAPSCEPEGTLFPQEGAPDRTPTRGPRGARYGDESCAPWPRPWPCWVGAADDRRAVLPRELGRPPGSAHLGSRVGCVSPARRTRGPE